jgi:outer membrane protein assembly factor BamB
LKSLYILSLLVITATLLQPLSTHADIIELKPRIIVGKESDRIDIYSIWEAQPGTDTPLELAIYLIFEKNLSHAEKLRLYPRIDESFILAREQFKKFDFFPTYKRTDVNRNYVNAKWGEDITDVLERDSQLVQQTGYDLGTRLRAEERLSTTFTYADLNEYLDKHWASSITHSIVAAHFPSENVRELFYQLFCWEVARGLLAGDLQLDESKRLRRNFEQVRIWKKELTKKPDWFETGEEAIYVRQPPLKAFSVTDGRLLWTRNEDVQIPPTESNGIAFFGTGKGSIFFAIDVKTGRQLWKRNLASAVDRLVSSPVAYQNTIIYLTKSRNVYAFDQRSGRTLWKQSIAEVSSGKPVTSGSLLIFWTLDNRDSIPGYLYAIDMTTGAVRWQQLINFNEFATDDDTLDLYPTDKTLYVDNSKRSLAAIDLATGTVRWTYRLPPETEYREPQIDFNQYHQTFHIAAADKVLSLDGQSGDLNWEIPTPKNQCSQLTSDRHNIFCATYQHGIKAFDIVTGKLQWDQSLPYVNWYQLNISANHLIGLGNSDLYLIQPETGTLDSQLKLGSSDSSSRSHSEWPPPQMNSRVLYFINKDRHLNAVSISLHAN